MSTEDSSRDKPIAQHGPLVDPAWLAAHQGNPRLRIIDATWQPLASPKDPRAGFETAHIPGAQFFDHRAIAAPESHFTDTRPTDEHFGNAIGNLGIGNDDFVVVYSQKGTAGGASRAWLLLRSFGHDRVAVLDGGIPRWQREGHATSQEPLTCSPVTFIARTLNEMVTRLDDLRSAVEAGGVQIVDARPSELFAGEGVFRGGQNPRAPKPTPGRIPGSHNLPSAAVIDPETKTLRAADELRALLASCGLDISRPVVTSCSLGVGASTLALVLAAAGCTDVAIFDGAWEEWGSHPHTPKERD